MVKKVFTPLEPQPCVTDIVVMKRYYATLLRDPSYKKRITWFEQLPSNFDNKKMHAVAKYIGKFPIIAQHMVMQNYQQQSMLEHQKLLRTL